MFKGLVQVYTGDGKGKTTAALGQGLRSVGCGMTVYMVQFLKNGDTGELNSCEKLGEAFQIHRFESERDFFWNLNEEQKKELQIEVNHALAFVEEIMKKEKCDVLILDEVMGAIHNKLIDEEQICEVIRNKPEQMEVILTGRNVPDSIAELADYVSEIVPRKHPIDKGIGARKGIEY